MYVKHVAIQNLRTFEKTSIDLNVPGTGDIERHPGVTLLLGNNGAGKTSVLRAIAMAALAPVITTGSGYVPFSLVRRAGKGRSRTARIAGRLLIDEQDGARKPTAVRTSLSLAATSGFVDRFVMGRASTPPWARAMYEDNSPAFLMLAYGASRRVEAEASSGPTRQKERLLRYARVAGLFEDHVNLMPLSSWLPAFRKSNPGRHTQVIELMNKLLPEGEMLEEPKDRTYLFKLRGSAVPFAAMSDGYRAYIGWIADLLFHVCMGAPSGKRLHENRGVVLVDEIDLHLHPEWQRRVIPMLSDALPNLQIIATSHSPLVVGTLSSAHVRSIEFNLNKRGEPTDSVVRPVLEELHGLSADQILTSDTFGLESTRDAGFADELKTVAAKARTGNVDSAKSLVRMMALGSAGAPARKAAKRTSGKRSS